MVQARFRRSSAALIGVAVLVGASVATSALAGPAIAAGRATAASPAAAASHAHSSPAARSLTLATIPDDQRVKGDFNGDGKSDIAILYNYPNTVTGFILLTSTGSAFIKKTWYLASNWDWNASKPMAGDFNGDGKADLAVLYDYGNATTSLFTLPSTGSSFGPLQGWYASGAGNWDWSRTLLA